jgi:hypothetical protein
MFDVSFSRSKDECLTWNEKFLAKSKGFSEYRNSIWKGFGFKMLRSFDKKTEDGRKKLEIIDVNEMVITEFIEKASWKMMKILRHV